MARRSSVGEDLVRAFALLPWWLCVILAVVAYYVLGHFAAQPLPAPVKGQAGPMMTAAIEKGWATAGQFIVPILLLAAAVLSAAARWSRKREEDAWPFPQESRGSGGPPPDRLTRTSRTPGATRAPRPASAPTAAPPGCPDCGSVMVARKARKGPTAGRSFWGCVNYPQCKGTRPM